MITLVGDILHVRAPARLGACLLSLQLICGAGALHAQVAGYRIGVKDLDLRSIPCSPNDGDVLCRPFSDLYLRVRGGVVVQIDTSWNEGTANVSSAPDVWRRIQPVIVTRFGPPDSVRILNSSKLPKAYEDGLAVFWKKEEWCAVLSIKTMVDSNRSVVTFVPVNLTLEKRGTWFVDCSVYPYLSGAP